MFVKHPPETISGAHMFPSTPKIFICLWASVLFQVVYQHMCVPLPSLMSFFFKLAICEIFHLVKGVCGEKRGGGGANVMRGLFTRLT